MKKIMQITVHLCQEFQFKSQDILSTMHLISSTKAYIQQYKGDKWDALPMQSHFGRNVQNNFLYLSPFIRLPNNFLYHSLTNNSKLISLLY
jgi:hypothetical protein